MCGTFNDNKDDDFLTSYSNYTTLVNEFGDSWRVNSNCNKTENMVKHPCDENPDKKAEALKRCEPLRGKTFSGIS